MKKAYMNKMLTAFIAVALITSVLVIVNKDEINVSAFPPTSTPGVDDFGNATADFYYMQGGDSGVTPTINTTGLTATTYYLYKPAYNCSASGDRNAVSLEWFEQVLRTDTSTAVRLIVSTPGELRALDGPIKLDRAGIWVFDTTDPSAVDGNDSTTLHAFFWVNTSQQYEIATIDSFDFGTNTTKTITVTEGGSAITNPCYIDLIAPDGTCLFHKYSADGVYSFGTYGNITQRGNYTIRAYSDLDLYSSAAYLYYDEGYTASYDNTYGIWGGGFTSALQTTLRETNGDHWNYTICGPWDPPEYNATESVFEVSRGTPSLSIPVGNQTMYHNFSGEINLTVKDTSGDKLYATDYHVEIHDEDGVNVTEYFIGPSPSAGNKDCTADINKYDGYALINASGWGMNGTVGYGDNGTWTIYIWSDLVGNDRNANGLNAIWTEEWNGSITFRVTRAPSAQFKWIDDDDVLSSDDNDGVIPRIPTEAQLPINLQFQVIGSDHTYYGATSQQEAMENITLYGNALFTGSLDKIPGVSYSGGTWDVPIIPTMSVGGGSITIQVTWSSYSTLTEVLDIGGTGYASNGSVVTVTNPEVTVGNDDYTIELQVTSSESDTLYNPWLSVYVYYIGETGEGGGLADQNPIATAIDHRHGGGSTTGTWSIVFNKTQQTTNQTAVGFTKEKAPRNLTVYVVDSAQTGYCGYARVSLLPKHDLITTAEAVASPGTSTILAGLEYNYFYINVTVDDGDDNTTTYPDDTAADRNAMNVQILNANGDQVTNSIFPSWSSSTIHTQLRANSPTPYYVARGANIYALTAGTYTVYAYNNSHTSEGNNGTFTVKQAHVECDKSPLIWMSDTNISATFTVTNEIDGARLNGTLRMENISWKTTYNQTYTNTSDAGNSTLDVSEGDGFTNGQITIDDITANFLPAGIAEAFITYWFQPDDANGNAGFFARCSGNLPIQVPTVTPEKAYIPVGRTSNVNILVTGRDNAPISDVFVELDGRGIDHQNATSGADGNVLFSLLPTSTGNITIDVGEQGRTVDTVIMVTPWVLDVSVSPSTVASGDDFTVTVKRESDGTLVEGAKVTITGIGTGTTLSDGTVTFTAPAVTSDRQFTITASADGYAPDPDLVEIDVTYTPTIYINAPSEAEEKKAFTVEAGSDDGNNNGIVITITDSSGSVVKTGITVNGEVSFKISKKGTYTITASKTGAIYSPDEPVTIKIEKPPGTPGFELLTLIAAIGVAYILLKRRRK